MEKNIEEKVKLYKVTSEEYGVVHDSPVIGAWIENGCRSYQINGLYKSEEMARTQQNRSIRSKISEGFKRRIPIFGKQLGRLDSCGDRIECIVRVEEIKVDKNKIEIIDGREYFKREIRKYGRYLERIEYILII